MFVGEPFTVRICALGTVAPRQPDTSALKDFAIEFERRIPFSYLDPIARRYVIARTNAAALQVTANRVLSASDAEGAVATPGARVAVPQDSLAGIAHNFDRPGALAMQSFGLAALIASPTRALAVATPPATRSQAAGEIRTVLP